MKIINAFFIAIVFLTFSAFGQSKNVLADGNPPLTQTMINRLTTLMQWSLASDFSDEERSELRGALVSYWKTATKKTSNPCSTCLPSNKNWPA